MQQLSSDITASRACKYSYQNYTTICMDNKYTHKAKVLREIK